MKNKIILVLFFLLPFFSYPQTDLTNLNSSWSQVMGGTFLQKPETTSYGFIGITDAKTLISISNSGMILWEKNFPINNSTIYKTVSDDFTVLITNSKKKVTLVNPSGSAIWSKVLDFEVTQKPIEGWDGRFFLCGKNNIICYGVNGIAKWAMELPDTSIIPVQTLTDGSIVVFLKNLLDGKTKAIRISPFGKQLEEIIFAGEVTEAFSCSKGIFLIFSDGSSGLFSLEENKAVNKYVISLNQKQIKKQKVVTDISSDFIWLLNTEDKGVHFYLINALSGSIISDFINQNINLIKLSETKITENGIFISDQSKAFYLSNDGNELWSGNLPDKQSKNRWTYLIFTQNNTLVICKDNWAIDAYVVSQSPMKKSKDYAMLKYNNYYTIDTSLYDTLYQHTFNKDLASKERYEKLRSGFYGNEEISYTSECLSFISAYLKSVNETDFGIKTNNTVFKTAPKDIESVFIQLPLYGTKDFSYQTAKILLQEKNPTLQNALIIGLEKNGYDPEGEILSALELISEESSEKNVNLRINICDAVYSICRFMGRPAFNKNGKLILSNFLYPTNNSRVKN
ncbi:MAG: hypothetical protein HUK25_05955, partial [Treponema sp.]|nr:hypothetical protein [Treponema sp.]